MGRFIENAEILEHVQVADGTRRLRVRSEAIARAARPGQFAMVEVAQGNDPLLRRPLSFHRVHAGTGEMEFLYRVVGRGTNLLSRLTPPHPLNILGPLGNGFALPRDGERDILLLAGGIGVAPLFELMARIAERSGPDENPRITLIYGARTAGELLPPEPFEPFGVVPLYSTDDGTAGFCGFVTQLLERVTGERGTLPDRLYACGPLPMQYHAARWAVENGVNAELSLESLMACGLGACLGCALPAPNPDDPSADRYVHVCKDGPVFPPGAIEWRKIPAIEAVPPIFQCK